MLAYDERWTRTEYVAFGIVAVLLSVAVVRGPEGGSGSSPCGRPRWAAQPLIAVGALFVRAVPYDEAGRALGDRSRDRLGGLHPACLAGREVAPRWRWRGGDCAAAFVVAGTGLLVLRPLEGSGYDAVTARGEAATFAAPRPPSRWCSSNPWRRGVRLGSVPAGSGRGVRHRAVGHERDRHRPRPCHEPVEPGHGPTTRTPTCSSLDGIGSPWLIAVAALALLVATEVVRDTTAAAARASCWRWRSSAGAIAILRYSMPLWAVVAALALAAVVTGCLAVGDTVDGDRRDERRARLPDSGVGCRLGRHDAGSRRRARASRWRF